MCPMRFVLVGVSMLIMSIGLWRCMREEEKEQQQQHDKQRQQHNNGGQMRSRALALSWQEMGKTLLDMFTGRYLFDYFSSGRAVHHADAH